ncbi:Uncharacterized protein SCF082_LOCUS27558, partial [Durusdinium trenchii]
MAGVATDDEEDDEAREEEEPAMAEHVQERGDATAAPVSAHVKVIPGFIHTNREWGIANDVMTHAIKTVWGDVHLSPDLRADHEHFVRFVVAATITAKDLAEMLESLATEAWWDKAKSVKVVLYGSTLDVDLEKAAATIFPEHVSVSVAVHKDQVSRIMVDHAKKLLKPPPRKHSSAHQTWQVPQPSKSVPRRYLQLTAVSVVAAPTILASCCLCMIMVDSSMVLAVTLAVLAAVMGGLLMHPGKKSQEIAFLVLTVLNVAQLVLLGWHARALVRKNDALEVEVWLGQAELDGAVRWSKHENAVLMSENKQQGDEIRALREFLTEALHICGWWCGEVVEMMGEMHGWWFHEDANNPHILFLKKGAERLSSVLPGGSTGDLGGGGWSGEDLENGNDAALPSDGGITDKDFALAAAMDDIAKETGVTG